MLVSREEIVDHLKENNYYGLIYAGGCTNPNGRRNIVTICFCPDEHFIIGSIGTVMPGVELRIDPENNEILVKGKTITSGYYKKPEENARAFTEDGYFRTGDAGYLKGNTLFFKERIKDLYKTSNGKYITPQAIEGMVGGDKYIQQIAVLGDKRKFVSALIVPDRRTSEKPCLIRENQKIYLTCQTLYYGKRGTDRHPETTPPGNSEKLCNTHRRNIWRTTGYRLLHKAKTYIFRVLILHRRVKSTFRTIF